MAAGVMLLLGLCANLILGLGLSGFLLWKASHWRRDYQEENISDREYRRLIICMIGVKALTVAGISGLGCLILLVIATRNLDKIPAVLIASVLFSLSCALFCIRFLHTRFLRHPRFQRANSISIPTS